MSRIETIFVLILTALMGGSCLGLAVLHLRALRDMVAQGKPLDREVLLLALTWGILALVILGVAVLLLLDDYVSSRQVALCGAPLRS
jgi:hypothetical protein